MAEVKWVKLTTDMFDNRKIKHLRRLPEGNNIVLIWVMLLTMAGRCNAGGMIFLTENIPYTPKMLADELDFEEGTVSLALKALEQLDMIVAEDNLFSIAGWEEYQNIDGLEKIREQTRKRVAKCREKKLLSQCNVTSNATVTECNAIEEEKERDKEKEYHSFVHSAPPEGKKEDDGYVENYVERKISEAGFVGKDAELYREELKEGLKLKYLGGTLGQGIILMSDEQFADLCDKLSLDEIEKYFGIVVECERSGKRYKKKSHYQAILDMAMKDRRVK
jgi:predicted phage replisome organizer